MESKYEVILSRLGNGDYDWSEIIISGDEPQYLKEKSVITYIRTSLVKGILKTISVDKLLDAVIVDTIEDAEIIYNFYKKNLRIAVDGIVFRHEFNKAVGKNL